MPQPMAMGEEAAQEAPGTITSPPYRRRLTKSETLGKMLAQEDVDEQEGAIRKLARTISKSWAFESFVGFAICVNAGVAWYETDLTAVPNDVEPPEWLDVFNILMFLLYALEMTLRLIALQRSFFHGLFNWNTFDLSLVLADGLMMLLRVAFPAMENNAAVRALRICRSFRLVKAVRVWPAFRELYVMMHGLMGAFKAMLWSFVLLFLVLTLFGIVAVEAINPLARELAAEGAFPGCTRCDRAFASVWDSMVTFFQQVVAGDSWGLLTIPIMERYPATCPFFIIVVVTIQFGILNLILVAIVDQAHKSQTEDAMFQARVRKEEFEKARVDLIAMCAEIDTDHSGEISLSELLHGFENMPELANQLRFLDLGKEDLRILFTALDQDGSGSVSYEEFVEQLFNMQNQDTAVMLSFLKSYVQDIRKAIREQTKDMVQIKKTMKDAVMKDLSIEKALGSSPDLGGFSEGVQSRSHSKEHSVVNAGVPLAEEPSGQTDTGKDSVPVKLREMNNLEMPIPSPEIVDEMQKQKLMLNSGLRPQELTSVLELQLKALDLLSQCMKDSASSAQAQVALTPAGQPSDIASKSTCCSQSPRLAMGTGAPDARPSGSIRGALAKYHSAIDARDFAVPETQPDVATAWRPPGSGNGPAEVSSV
eukprot:TRINITY_DN11825_c1_g1_i1.p1 TRINITY_DN11825_c1_g1~~TRINITY_DN11825_c1_g1_i1.p1  ORF type:complete len:650 (-),score=138.50 TRINITY_DN11825_c1_g1_i1:8-1957(-)